MAKYIKYGDPFKLEKVAYESKDGEIQSRWVRHTYGIAARVSSFIHKSIVLQHWPSTFTPDGVEVLLPYMLYASGSSMGYQDETAGSYATTKQWMVPLDEPVPIASTVLIDKFPGIYNDIAVEVNANYRLITEEYAGGTLITTSSKLVCNPLVNGCPNGIGAQYSIDVPKIDRKDRTGPLNKPWYVPYKSRKKILGMLGMTFEEVRDIDTAGAENIYMHFKYKDHTNIETDIPSLYNTMKNEISDTYRFSISTITYDKDLFSLLPDTGTGDMMTEQQAFIKSFYKPYSLNAYDIIGNPIGLIYVLYALYVNYHVTGVDVDCTVKEIGTVQVVEQDHSDLEGVPAYSYVVTATLEVTNIEILDATDYFWKKLSGTIDNRRPSINSATIGVSDHIIYPDNSDAWEDGILKLDSVIGLAVGDEHADAWKLTGQLLGYGEYSDNATGGHYDEHSDSWVGERQAYLRKDYVRNMSGKDFNKFFPLYLESGARAKRAGWHDRVWSGVAFILIVAIAVATGGSGITLLGATGILATSVVLGIGAIGFYIYSLVSSNRGMLAAAGIGGHFGGILTNASAVTGFVGSIYSASVKGLAKMAVVKVALKTVADQIGGFWGDVVNIVGTAAMGVSAGGSTISNTLQAFSATFSVYKAWNSSQHNEEMRELRRDIEENNEIATDIMNETAKRDALTHPDMYELERMQFYNYDFCELDPDYYIRTHVTRYVPSKFETHFTPPPTPLDMV